MVELYLIPLRTESDIFPTFQHGGIETIYMLEGEIGYRHSGSLYHLRPWRRSVFRFGCPAWPEVLERLPARYLSIIAHPQNGQVGGRAPTWRWTRRSGMIIFVI